MTADGKKGTFLPFDLPKVFLLFVHDFPLLSPWFLQRTPDTEGEGEVLKANNSSRVPTGCLFSFEAVLAGLGPVP